MQIYACSMLFYCKYHLYLSRALENGNRLTTELELGYRWPLGVSNLKRVDLKDNPVKALFEMHHCNETFFAIAILCSSLLSGGMIDGRVKVFSPGADVGRGHTPRLASRP